MTAKKLSKHLVAFSPANFDRLRKLKAGYMETHKIKRLKHSDFFGILLDLAETMASRERYLWQGKLYQDLPELRGRILEDSVRRQVIPEMPLIVLELGADTFLKDGKA